MKLGNTEFNQENVKGMTLKQFRQVYGNLLKGIPLDVAYEKLTGKKPKKNVREA